MSETSQRPGRQPRRLATAVALVALVALGAGFWLANGLGTKATECPAQAAAAAKIDAAATGDLAALNGTGTGRSYADMAFTDAAGKPLTIADFAGKKLLVNFWASWCIPCRAEMPELDGLAASYNGDTFMVLPVNTGETQEGKAAAFVADGKWAHLPLYIDPKFAVIDRLKTTAVSIGLPATVLLDEKGCELAVLQGPATWNSADGHRVIDALLGV